MSSDEEEASHVIVVEAVRRLGESLFFEVEIPSQEAFHWWKGERSTDPAVRLIVEFSIGVSSGQEGIVLRIKQQIQDFLESAEVGSHRLSGPSEKYKVRA